MILRDIRDYIKQQQHVSVEALCLQFDINADALRAMLSSSVISGKLHHHAANQCGDCTSCGDGATEFYEWRTRNKPIHWHSQEQ